MNLNVNKLVKNFFNVYFWGQHPDSALRYLPVVAVIKNKKLGKAKILEVGSGSLGIVPYFKREIDGIDIDFSGPQTKLLRKIKGSATDLPFRKNSYDVVISVDVIEHLPANVRKKAVSEIVRVAKKLVIIVMPLGKLSMLQDQELYRYWRKKMKGENQFLLEHLENGLPTTDEILVFLDKSVRDFDKPARIRSFPTLNLLIRKLLMKTWISNSKFLYYLYLKGFLLLLPILRRANFGNCYRRVFVVEFASPVNSHLEPYSDRIGKAKGKK